MIVGFEVSGMGWVRRGMLNSHVCGTGVKSINAVGSGVWQQRGEY